MTPAATVEVRHEGRRVGTITRDAGRLAFAYDDTWRSDPHATPLSLSMPLAARHHRHDAVDAYLWGLLPDNDAVLARWGRDFGVSTSHPLDLVTHVGDDLPGAMQIVRPADDESTRAEPTNERASDVDRLDEADVARLLAAVRADHTAWLGGTAGGRWSLAGAQPKIALLEDDHGRWGRPRGRTATNRILKPAIAGLDDHDLNEHLCLRAGALLGLRTVRTRIETFLDERAIVIERYDRVATDDGAWRRVHQEDLCQALAVHPARKYQHDGGPGPAAIVACLRGAISDPDRLAADVDAFVDAVVFSWLIAGPDAHAKNYALLLAGPNVRLAPLYDIASAAPYPDVHLPKLKLAMKIGRSYRLYSIGASAWARFADEIDVDADRVLARAQELASAVVDSFATAARDEQVVALGSDLPARLIDAVARRAETCTAALRRGAPHGS